jgi:tRNA pseudouridine13 synthase
LRVPKIDELLGMGVYVTETAGVRGVIRQSVSDFMVEEILVDGSKAQIENVVKSHSLGASLTKQEYLLCILVKRNWDTFIAIKNIAKELSKSQDQVKIAGIKDAKAVTAQHITIQHASVEDVIDVCIKDIELRPVGYLRKELSTYYLLGNSFKIRIKDIANLESTIRKKIAKTKQELELGGGIPNYFGHQRFGTTRPITHVVGKALLKGDFAKAAMIFLAEPSFYEHPSSRQARKKLQSTQNFKLALENFPKQLRYERLMLAYLVQRQDDFVGAFRRLPAKLQALFVQAYQSYLFNRFLTARIKQGIPLNKAELGDWVVRVERSGLPMVNTAKIVSGDDSAEIESLLKNGKMRVALPLVGCNPQISRGSMGQIQKQILDEEEVNLENFKMKELTTMGARGGLRAITAPIRDFKMHDVSFSAGDRGLETLLSFVLLRGCYATVLLREIMKPNSPICSGF